MNGIIVFAALLSVAAAIPAYGPAVVSSYAAPVLAAPIAYKAPLLAAPAISYGYSTKTYAAAPVIAKSYVAAPAIASYGYAAPALIGGYGYGLGHGYGLGYGKGLY